MGRGWLKDFMKRNAVASILPSTSVEIMKLLAHSLWDVQMNPCFLMKMLCKLKLLKLPIYPQSV